MTIQFPAVMPAAPDAVSAAPEEVPAEGFAAMVDALIAALVEDAGSESGAGEESTEEEIDAVIDAVAVDAAFLAPGFAAAPSPPSAAAAVVVSIGAASGPGAVLPGCGCCSGGNGVEPFRVVEAQVQPVVDQAGPGLEGAAPGLGTESAAPAARAAGPSVLTVQIVERVVELIARQQAVTPPSTMVIELPEAAGARIAVTMHASGVHLSFTGLGAADLAPLVPQLQSGLAAAGMTLAGWSADAEGGQPGRGGDGHQGEGESAGDDADRPKSFAEYLGI